MNEELRQLLSEEFKKNNIEINKRFDKIDERFDKIDERFDLLDNEIKVNRTNMIVGFKEGKEERNRIENKINNLFNAVDGFIKIVTKLEDEFAALKEDLNRVKAVLREKLGVEL